VLYRRFLTSGYKRVGCGVDLILRDAFGHETVSSIGALPAGFRTHDK
jgi:hypothetical protein